MLIFNRQFYFVCTVIAGNHFFNCACSVYFERAFLGSITQSQQFGRGSWLEVSLTIYGKQAQVAGNGVRATVLGGRNIVGVLPVAHPCDSDAAVVGSITPSHGGIMVFSPVHPFGFGGWFVYKLFSVEGAYKILSSTSSERTSGIQITKQHPFLIIGTFYWKFKQIGTFPNTTMCTLPFTETTFKGPIFQIRRREYLHLLPYC